MRAIRFSPFSAFIIFCLFCILYHCVSSNEDKNHSPTFTVISTGNDAKSTATSDTIARIPKRRLKILIHNPSLGWSHSQFLGAVADTLVDAGHEVHIFGYSMNSMMGNYTGSHKAQKLIWHKRLNEKNDVMAHPIMASGPFDGPSPMIWSGLLPHFILVQNEACKELLDNKELLAYLHEQSYDFGIAEIYGPCSFGIFKHVGVKASASATAVTVNSLITSVYGVPSFSSFVYDLFVIALTNPLKMNLLQRATNLFLDIYTYFSVRDLNFQDNQKYFDAALSANSPSLRNVMRNVSLAFVNNKEFFALTRPLSYKIVYIGGIAEKDKKTTKKTILPEHFKSVIDAAPKGTVLFSFGTMADTTKMAPELKRTFADTFAKFPDYAFIWKLNLAENETLELPSNVHIFDWVPQTLVLDHPGVKVFMSHCGLNSANEAAEVGIPVLGIPLFGDQPYNAATIVNKGFGLAVDIRDIKRSGRILEKSLHRLLNDAKFAERARLVSRKLALTPFSPRERLVKWVEFAAEFENFNELNMPTENEMGFLAYYSLDVILAALMTFGIIGYVTLQILALAWCKISRSVKQKTL